MIDERWEYARGVIQYLIFFRWLHGRASRSTVSLAFCASRIYRRDIIRNNRGKIGERAKGRDENAAWQNMIAVLNRCLWDLFFLCPLF